MPSFHSELRRLLFIMNSNLESKNSVAVRNANFVLVLTPTNLKVKFFKLCENFLKSCCSLEEETRELTKPKSLLFLQLCIGGFVRIRSNVILL